MQDRNLHDRIHFVGRVLIASYFAARGLGVIVEPGTMEALVREMPVPPLLAVVNSAFLLTTAIFIALGIHTRFAALLLAVYVFWSSYIFNILGIEAANLGAFWKDLAIIAGLVMLVGHGRGIWAFDNLIARENDAKEAGADPLTNGEGSPEGHVADETALAALEAIEAGIVDPEKTTHGRFTPVTVAGTPREASAREDDGGHAEGRAHRDVLAGAGGSAGPVRSSFGPVRKAVPGEGVAAPADGATFFASSHGEMRPVPPLAANEG